MSAIDKLNRADDQIDKIIGKILEDPEIEGWRKRDWLQGQIDRAENDIITSEADEAPWA